jgi:hypothetical protein
MAVLGDQLENDQQQPQSGAEAAAAALSSLSTSADNDPWQTTAPAPATSENSFGDDFKPFAPLPDSIEYLTSLESKLVRVQKTGSLVRDLQAKREDEMRRFMAGDHEAVQQYQIEEGEMVASAAKVIQDNPLIRRIAPELQVRRKIRKN